MLADPLTPLSFAQLFDTLPNGVLYYRAVRNGVDQHLVDFIVDYANPAFQKTVQGRYQATVGTSVRHDNRHDANTTEFVFAQLKAVAETGQPNEFEYYNPLINEWLSVSRAKAGDGVLSVSRIITASKQAAQANERQQSLLNGILNTSLNTTFVYEAIRDEAGQIQDFGVLLVNEQGRRDVSTRTGIDPVGKTLLSINPNSRQSGQFNLFCQVIESGEPVQGEQFYPDAQAVWYNTAITKLNDGVVVTGIDITAQKQIALEAERQAKENKRQANYLNNVLDASSNGIVAERAVRNAEGTIVDFLIMSANQRAAEIVDSTVGALVGRSDLELHPMLRSSGLFDAYVRTVETGEPQFIETQYNDGRLDYWLEVNTRKLADEELVITFSNVSEVKRAQQNLEQARANLQAVIDTSQTGILVFSPVYDATGDVVDFRYKTVNRMVAALVGQTPAALTEALASDWFASYRDTPTFDHCKHTSVTGEEQRFTIHSTVDGLDVWADVQSAKFGDDILVTIIDYTDLKRAQLTEEQQAKENKRQAGLLSSVLDSSNSGIIAFESIRNERGIIVDFSFTTINQTCEQILNVPLETMWANTLLSLFPGNVETGLFGMYVNTTETGEPSLTEVYYNLDGLNFWLDISAQKLGDGFVVTFTDVSVMKRAAKLVEESVHRLQTVIDMSQTAIFLLAPQYDNDGTITDFLYRALNQTLADYVRQTPADMIGTPVSRWFPAYKIQGFNFQRYCEVFDTHQPQRFEIHYDADGLDAWLDVSVARIGDEILVTFLDYSSLKQLQQQLESSVVDLQRSNANLEQFAYVASHDLQEPLRKIQAFGDIIQSNYAPVIGDEGADMIRRMQSAAARMQALIKDVLVYSRVATKRDDISPVDLNQLVADVVDDLETAIADRNVAVTIEPLPTIMGDDGQLRQLFQNLLSNALKFTKSHHTPDETRVPQQQNAFITVTARTMWGREAGMAIPPGDADRLFHLIEVDDNGIGFEPHQAERIFQVFQRLHNRSTYQGTGIGLAIVKKVVENHNGHIQAMGRPGEGAAFRILLPA